MFDHLLYPFYTSHILEFSKMDIELKERASIFWDIAKLYKDYFNTNPDFLNYIISIETYFTQHMCDSLKAFKDTPELEYQSCKIPMTLGTISTEKWMKERWLKSVLYSNIANSKNIPSIQKMKTLKSIGLL
jgi:hypothetical protein